MTNPILFSAKYDTDGCVVVPQVGRLVIVHFSVVEGDVQVFFGAEDSVPSLKLYPGARWNQRIAPFDVRKIFLRKYTTSGFVVWVTIEKFGTPS